jgi:hypothetical protein
MPSTHQLQLPPTTADAQDTLDTQFGVNTQLLAQPVFFERDRDWEAELLGQLSEQEQRLRDFTRTRFANDPYSAVQSAIRMVQALDAYTACQAERATLVRAHLPETRKGSGQYILKAESLAKPLPPRTVLGIAIGPPRIGPAQRQAYSEIVRELPGAIEPYLLLLGNGFATGPMAAKWVETSGVFVRQLTKLVNHVTDAPLAK